MNIAIRFFTKDTSSQVPDHIRVTKSLFGETGTITFTFKNFEIFNKNLEKIHSLHQIEVLTEKHLFITKDIRILWVKGRPYLLQAVFVIQNENLFNYFFENLDCYAVKKGLAFFNTD